METRLAELDSFLRRHTEREENHLAGITHSMEYYGYPYDPDKKAFQLLLSEYYSIKATRHSRFTPTEPHYHDCIEISYMYDGTITQTIAGNEVPLKKGDMTLVDSNTVHSYSTAGENDLLINIILSKEILTMDTLTSFSTENPVTAFLLNAMRADNKQDNYLIFNVLSSPRLLVFLNEFLYEEFFPTAMHEQIMKNLLMLIISDMMQTIQPDRMTGRLSRSNLIVSQALSYIEENYLTCSLEDIAEAIGVNSAYLTTLIRNQTGEKCMDLIIKKRMQHAANLLLRTNLPIDQIIEGCGYHNMTYFYEKFEKIYGESPRKYRIHHSETKRFQSK